MGVRHRFVHALTATALLLIAAVPSAALVIVEPPESQRLQRAKDLIADESWPRAIAELEAAIADAREASKDEALFWLAHSQYQVGDSAGALRSIRRLETDFGKSRWVRPAGSLRIEIAQRLRRTDVLWFSAVPPPPPAPPAPPGGVTPATPPVPPAPAPASRPRVRRLPMPPPMPPPPPGWLPADYHPDVEMRIQALGSLILTDSEHAPHVIPMLRDIALETDSPAQARRALFAIGQSSRPEARRTVVEVATSGSETARIAAVRVLGRLRGADVSPALLQVYSTGGEQVKQQVVTAFAERAETHHLRMLYDRAPLEAKRTIINSLFDARDEAGLMAIAGRERLPALRTHVLDRLRLLRTLQRPK